MMDACLASIVNEGVCEPRHAANTTNGDNLACWQSLVSLLVSSIKQFKKGHRRGEYGRNVRLQAVFPYLCGPVIEVVISYFGS